MEALCVTVLFRGENEILETSVLVLYFRLVDDGIIYTHNSVANHISFPILFVPFEFSGLVSFKITLWLLMRFVRPPPC
mgnify:CR=1 FL=1|jgi:hypothetical protein